MRPGRPFGAAVYESDALSETRHFIAVDGDDRIVGCVTIFPEPWPGSDDAWRLRGMGVADELRGAGVGRKLLQAVDEFLRGLDRTPLIWCNARCTAVGFYERCGWEVASDVFDLPDIGPHVNMTRRL